MTPRPGAERFVDWLLRTQLVPTFSAHAFVQRAVVLVAPRLWEVPGADHATPLLIVYGAADRVDLDAAIAAAAEGAPDANLPPGLTAFALHRPILRDAAGRPPLVMCTPADLAGAPRSDEHVGFAVLDAFALVATFARAPSGALTALHLDAQLAARLDRVM